MANVDASPATRKLYECMLLVEACGASAELTTAIVALGELDAMLQAEAIADLVSVRSDLTQLREGLEKLIEQYEALGEPDDRTPLSEYDHGSMIGLEVAHHAVAEELRALIGPAPTTENEALGDVSL